jgi:Cyclic nucleotide-binding domain
MHPNLNWFLHAANIILVVGYSVSDILWLRLLAATASLISLPFYFLQPTTLWAPILWTILFAGINLFQSWRLYVERRPVQLTPEEEQVRRLAFPELPPRKLLQALDLGVWTTEAPGKHLIESGKIPESIALLVQGKVRITRAERVLGDLTAGDFVGSALLMTGVPAEVDAVVTEPARAVSWQVATLQTYLNANPEVRIAMLSHLSRDLAAKVGHLSNH